MQQRQWGVGIGHEMAKRFHRDGCRLAALTFKKSTHEFTLSQKDVPYELVISHDEVIESETDSSTTLEEICEQLGVESIWPIVMSMRNHVYSYGDKYYFSFRQNRSDADIVRYVKNLYDRVSRIFDKFRPDAVVMANFVSMPQVVVGLVARRRNIRVASFTDSKISGVHAPVTSPYLDEGAFMDRVRELDGGAESQNVARAKAYINKFRESFIAPAHTPEESRATGWGRVKNELVPYWASARFLMGKGSENHVEGFGVTIDYRPPRIILRDHYRAKSYRKAAASRTYDDMEKIGPFVYLPLQVQPEAQIDMLATHFANQIETARQVALSLPGDYTLAVKEHPSMLSRRSPSFHEKIARLPNVKLLNPRIPAAEVLKRCALIVSPGGTAVVEAAFYSKAAIQFGRHGFMLLLPNVTRHTDMTTLSGAIKKALAQRDLNSEAYETRLRNFVAAAYDVGLEIPYGRIWYGTGHKEEYDSIYAKYRDQLERYT